MKMSEAKINLKSSRIFKKLIIILFSVISLAAIITIVIILFVNAVNNEMIDGGCG